MILFPKLRFPDDRLALEFQGKQFTYSQLATAIADYCRVLRSAGVRAESRVAVWTYATWETLVMLAGNAMAGVVSVPLNPMLGEKERTHILADSMPERIFDPREGISSNTRELNDAMPEWEGAPSPSTTALILYTSGTTGAPKGAMLSYANIASNLDALAEVWQWTEADHLVHALPMFHVHGLVLGWFGSLRRGAGFTWLGKFQIEELTTKLPEASLFFAVPTMYHRLIEAATGDSKIGEALRHPRLLISGSAALPLREHQRIQSMTGRRVIERYGLTETLINCAVSPADLDAGGKVGRPLEGIELRLVDEERRSLDCADDATIGEVAVRGPNVFKGYLNQPEATSAVMDSEGWFYTGDLATRDAQGRIRIVGRKSMDLIKTGGFKVGAGEIEAVLLEHPQVLEAAVVGLADPDLGDRIEAFVVLRAAGDEGEMKKELTNWVASSLSPYKRPRNIRFVDHLPKNAMGKVVKGELKKGLSS